MGGINMPVRMTGMISGMDTESLIKSMVDAQRLKNKKTTDKSTLLEWKQDKWKELNTKLFKLYQEDLSKLRLQGNYTAKKVTSSDDKLVDIKANNGASTGTNSVTVNELASSQSVTSIKLDNADINSKLKDLIGNKGLNLPIGDNDGIITIGYKEKETNLIITDETTLGDLVNAFKRAGLSASFDNNQNRLYISSKNSGETEKFTVISKEISNAATTALTKINELLNSSSLSGGDTSSIATALDNIRDQLRNDNTADISALYEKVEKMLIDGTPANGSTDAQKSIIKALTDIQKNLISSVENSTRQKAVKTIKDGIELEIVQKLKDQHESTEKALQSRIAEDAEKELSKKAGWEEKTQAEKDAAIQSIVDEKYNDLSEEEKEESIKKFLSGLTEIEYSSADILEEPHSSVGMTKAAHYKKLVEDEYNNNIGDKKTEGTIKEGLDALKGYLANYTEAKINERTSGNSLLTAFGLDDVTGSSIGSDGTDQMKVVEAKDASITLNGVAYTGSSNVFTINGYTITAKGETTQAITFTTINDTQANYDMIKKFVTNYNTLLKEMNELYYSASSRGYDPLSDDEKESMSEKQIDKWEDKIKGSILRRDDTLGTLLNTLNMAMMSTVEIDGKKYSLSTLGIKTSSDYTEKGLLHIDGDQDDALVSGLTNKLMEALEQDPDLVGKIVSGISKNLYDSMGEKMRAIPNVRSAFTFYNDKTMAKEQTEYQKKIKLLEKKLVDVENKYYKQFAAMESALSKLQSQTNALAGMLGTNSK